MASPFIRTSRGYTGLDLVSALHKDLRRNEPTSALYWAHELIDMDLCPLLVSRLRVALEEDLGVHDQASYVAAHTALSAFRELYPDKKGWRLALANIILAVCRAEKSRDGDNLNGHVLHLRQVEAPRPLPDYCFDHHTATGKKMGRTEANFGHESYRLLPKDFSDPEIKAAGERAFAWQNQTGRSLEDKLEPRPISPAQKRLEGGK